MENQGTPNQENINQQFNQQFGQQAGGQKPLPNSTAVLVMGIISIVGCFCYGIVGLVLGIIALVLAAKDTSLYQQNPGMFSEVSYKNMKAGKVCAIIGLSLSALMFIIIIIELVIFGSLATSAPWSVFR
jgi:hypothetical protein